MGEFVSSSAIYTQSAESVVQSVQAILSKKGVVLSKVNKPEQANYDLYGTIQKPKNGWIVVTWPAYFNVYEAKMAELLSVELGLPILTAGIYDGDYWYHYVYDGGKLVDEYSSVPDYWAQSKEESDEILKKKIDNSSILSKYLHTERESIFPYLVHAHNSKGKAHASDKYELSDPWVFVDFWLQAGIAYPDNPNDSYVILQFPDRFVNTLSK